MPHDEHKQECCEEVTKLLRTLIEVEVEQAEQLGRLSAKLETALCILERIARNTEVRRHRRDAARQRGVVRLDGQ